MNHLVSTKKGDRMNKYTVKFIISGEIVVDAKTEEQAYALADKRTDILLNSVPDDIGVDFEFDSIDKWCVVCNVPGEYCECG